MWDAGRETVKGGLFCGLPVSLSLNAAASGRWQDHFFSYKKSVNYIAVNY